MMNWSEKIAALLPKFFTAFILLAGLATQPAPAFAQAKDSIGLLEEIEEAFKPYIDNKEVYKNPDYFKDIPLAEYEETDDNEADEAFAQMKNRYSSGQFDYTERERDYTRANWFRRLGWAIGDFFRDLFPRNTFNWISSTQFLNILTIIGLCILAYIIYRLTIAGKTPLILEDKAGKNIPPDMIEKHLEEIDLKTYLNQALTSEDYILAIRYLHLMNLKKLAGTGLIKWNYKKTNREFLYEMQDPELANDFSRSIKIYEYIWYGKFAVSEDQYNEYEQIFQQLNSKIA